MSTEKIIAQILSRRPEISREDIMERLEKAKARTGGLISDKTLLRMIAAEFNVEISQYKASTPTLSIRDLIPSLNDVTLVGRVVAVFPPKVFKGNKSGKVASLLVADQSDISRVVLWNDKTSLVESGEIKVGQIIRCSHGYTREDRSGRVELHVGEKSEIEINPRDVEAKDYPAISKFTTKIGEITQAYQNKKVNITGMVKELFSVSTFQRKDSSAGKVMRFMLVDETSEIPVVIWNEKVDELEKTLKKGVRLRIVNAKVKKAIGESFEIHVDAETYVETLAPEEEFLKIADLKEGLSHVNVEGAVVTKPMLRDIKTSKGELVKLATFELKDGTGRIWVSAWRMHADSVKDLKLGDKVIMKNAYVKKGFGEQLEISTRNTTSILIRVEKQN
jgi:replication factor A1